MKTAVFLAVNASYSHTNPAGWSLGRVAAAIGWRWHIVEAVAREPVQPLLLRLAKSKPDILAATFFLFNRDFLLSILARFKLLHPTCLILAGGPEFLGDNRVFLKQHRFIDAAIRGEGERALADFLPVWDRPECRQAVSGLCAWRGGEYIDNGTAVPPALDALPSPLPDDFDTPGKRFGKPFLLFEAARGCAAQCVFCASGAGHPATRYFPIEYVRANLRRLQAGGLPEVRLADRTFNESPARCITMLRMFREEFPNMRFHLEIDPGRLTDDVMEEFTAAPPGQLYLEAGVQTLTPTVFQHLGRRGRLADSLIRTRQLCRMQNLQTHTDLIAGLPDGALTAVLTDMRTLVAMRPAVIQLEILKLLPGTALAANPERWGIKAAPGPPYEVLATDAMPPEDMEIARQLSKLTDWFYNAPDLQAVTAEAAGAFENFWVELSDVCRAHTGVCDAPSLENRFKLLDGFIKSRARQIPDLIHRLHYARLKHSLTRGYGMKIQPWNKPLPAGVRLIEGASDVKPAQICLARLDQPYFFVYGREHRRAVAIHAF